MEIQDAVQWTDEFVFARTGQHLDSLQRAILEGVWEHKGYKDIAEEYHCSNDHVRKSASELWKLLSEMLGEEVKKKNVRSLIENRVFSYHNNGVQIGSNITLCNDLYNNPKKTIAFYNQQNPSTAPQPQPSSRISEPPQPHRRTRYTPTMDTCRK